MQFFGTMPSIFDKLGDFIDFPDNKQKSKHENKENS